MVRTALCLPFSPLAASLLVVIGSTPVFAQATVPPAGEGDVTLTYQNYYVTGHFDAGGRKNKNGATHTQAVLTEFDYALTDEVGLSVTLSFIASKYTGGSSYFVGGRETFPGPLDDYTYHAAFQDLRIEVRRMFEAGRVSITPFIGVSFPTHHYETIGEAVPGRRRAELQCGAAAASFLDPRVAGRLRSHALCLRRCTRDFRVPGDEEHARRRGGTCRNVACEPQSCFELAIPAYGAEAARPSAHLGGT